MTHTRAMTNALRRRNIKVATSAAAAAVVMVALSFAAVPLYRIFCQVTGFAGTTQRADAPSQTILGRTITVRFDSNTAPGLPWEFKAVEKTMTLKIGENRLAFYRAHNTSAKTIRATATFNVTPEIAGRYFSKVSCFCFTEQTLEPGQSVDMPVSFFIDPEIVNDADARDLANITLSYTFFPVKEPAVDVSGPAKGT